MILIKGHSRKGFHFEGIAFFDQILLKGMTQVFRWSLFCEEEGRQGSRGSLSLVSL